MYFLYLIVSVTVLCVAPHHTSSQTTVFLFLSCLILVILAICYLFLTICSRYIVVCISCGMCRVLVWTVAHFLGVWQMAQDALCPPPSSAKFENVWTYTSTPPYILMLLFLINPQKPKLT